jgi:CBS domain-containing protein
MKRLAVVVPLKEGAQKDAERLLFGGPPFDPADAGFTRHSVYLTSKEAVFVFEGPEVEWSLDDLVSDFFHPALHLAELEWEKIEQGRPRIGPTSGSNVTEDNSRTPERGRCAMNALKTETASPRVSLTDLRVEDVMHRGVLTCPVEAPLPEVARMMAAKRIHCVVVQGGGGANRRLWGVLSDTDLLEAIADGDAEDASAGGTVRSPAVTVSPAETVIEAARLMSTTGVTHLVVADAENDRPIGVLSTLDLAAALAGEPRSEHPAARVEQLMTTDVVTVSPETPLKGVAAILIEHRISGVPVVSDEKVVGVVSEDDILRKERRAEAHPRGRLLGWLLGGERAEVRKLTARTAGEAMTVPAVTISHWRTAASAAALMIDHGIKRLPVLRKGELVGIVTRADLVRGFARSDAAIERDIREDVLRRSFWMGPGAIQVEVRHGEVTLKGQVENEAVVDTLPGAIRAVPGVISVRSELIPERFDEGR